MALPHLRATVARALQQAGPAHLNAPFREPLAPVPGPLPEVRDEPAVQHLCARGVPDVSAAARDLSARPRGIILCGPRDGDDGFPAAVRELSRALGYAVLADAASGVQDAVAHADLILRSEPWARALRPQAVVRLGGGLSSKVLQAFAEQAERTVVVHERGEPADAEPPRHPHPFRRGAADPAGALGAGPGRRAARGPLRRGGTARARGARGCVRRRRPGESR